MIVIVGHTGQLGREFTSLKKDQALLLGRNDIRNLPVILEENQQKGDPITTVINCAAYTNVNQAGNEKYQALKANVELPDYLAYFCKQFGAKLVHFSTDYVFDGKQKGPYLETANKNPINFYGYTKSLGEDKVLNSGCDCLIVRTSGVYSHLRQNFVKAIYKKYKAGEELKVVNDQFCNPTWSKQIAKTVLKLLDTSQFLRLDKKVIHYTSKGECTWYDFANYVLPNDAKITPISSSDFKSPVNRPQNSLLDCSTVEKFLDIYNWKFMYDKARDLIEVMGMEPIKF